mmetsp:Transcript_59369/g.128360  ORF Transcript_59369/g.128360 Transcript_59369/m.128360 type:complete len:207 (-) Transcript_59369:539-1159(-)
MVSSTLCCSCSESSSRIFSSLSSNRFSSAATAASVAARSSEKFSSTSSQTFATASVSVLLSAVAFSSSSSRCLAILSKVSMSEERASSCAAAAVCSWPPSSSPRAARRASRSSSTSRRLSLSCSSRSPVWPQSACMASISPRMLARSSSACRRAVWLASSNIDSMLCRCVACTSSCRSRSSSSRRVVSSSWVSRRFCSNARRSVSS